MLNTIRDRSLRAEQQEFPLLKAGDAMPTRSLHVRTIDRKTAADFVCQWHYSKRMGTGKRVSFGAYFNGELYAVAAYGPPPADMYPGKYLSKVTGHNVNRKNHFELVRLCRVGGRDEKDKWPPLTQFLAHCHRILRRDYKIKYVVAFSDPDERTGGHLGTIYKAANFQYLGKTAAVYHVIDENGVIRHRRVAYRYKENLNFKKYGPKPWPPEAMTIAEARKILGLTPTRTQPKDRWFLVIDGR